MSWVIDSSHSSIQFWVRHLAISKARGVFETFTGSVDFNEVDPAASTVSVQVDVDSINTKDEKRDGHLKSPDFFDVANFPALTFVSKQVEVVDATHGKIIGDLTIRGVTNEVTLNTEYNGQSKSPWGTTSAGFSADAKISRKEWGLVWNAPLETGGVLVGDEVTISIELEIVKQVEVPA